MINKSFLVDKVVNCLLKNNFEVFLTHGCFDIAAKREYLMLVKGLTNVDSLTGDQALSLRAVSYFLSAHPFVVSVKNNREFLSDDVIYSRFDLPVLTPRMFEDIIEEEDTPTVQSSKGRHTVNINTFTLKEKRKEMGFTLEELSRIIGVSKKALYEIENRRVNPRVDTVKKLESILRVDLRLPYEMKSIPPTYLKPENEFQDRVSREFSRIGIDNSSVYSAPFEIIGREKYSLITSLSKNTAKVKRDAVVVKKLSSIFSSYAVFIARRCKEKSVEGIPVILETELPDIESPKEFSEIIKDMS